MNETVIKVVKNIPWRKVIKVVGVTALGTASVLGAMESDDKTQTMIKKVAAKVVKNEMESN